MKAAIQTIRNHANAIHETIDQFTLYGEIDKCVEQINASMAEISAKLKYMQIRAEEIEELGKIISRQNKGCQAH